MSAGAGPSIGIPCGSMYTCSCVPVAYVPSTTRLAAARAPLDVDARQRGGDERATGDDRRDGAGERRVDVEHRTIGGDDQRHPTRRALEP